MVQSSSYALSFYRSQNVLCQSKFFVSDQKFIYILCQSQTFCARTKDDLHSVKKVFEEALNAIKFLDWLKTFGPAQNILGLVKGQGISIRKQSTLKYIRINKIVSLTQIQSKVKTIGSFEQVTKLI